MEKKIMLNLNKQIFTLSLNRNRQVSNHGQNLYLQESIPWSTHASQRLRKKPKTRILCLVGVSMISSVPLNRNRQVRNHIQNLY